MTTTDEPTWPIIWPGAVDLSGELPPGWLVTYNRLRAEGPDDRWWLILDVAADWRTDLFVRVHQETMNGARVYRMSFCLGYGKSCPPAEFFALDDLSGLISRVATFCRENPE